MRTWLAAIILTFITLQSMTGQMTEILDFGSNPGNLQMYLYQPSQPQTQAGVVLVLHGCGQTAENFATQTGWNVLAEQYGFYVVFAQQKASNNPTRCFNWFLPGDNRRDKGEARSLYQMVEYTTNRFSTNTDQVFVCGLSAGGSMTPVMMACYPDVFAGGGTWAGVPYLYRPTGNNDLTPDEWGNKVRQAYPNYSGPYPTLFICQGTEDGITEPVNAQRLAQQWTNVHLADDVPDVVNSSFDNNPIVQEEIYLSTTSDTIVKSYTIEGMSHGIAVDPGTDMDQGGQVSVGAYDVDFYSTYWMAKCWGLTAKTPVSTTNYLDDSNIKITRLDGGELHISLLNQTKPMYIRVIDVMGRVIMQRSIRNNMVIPKSNRNGEVVGISIYTDEYRRAYHTLVFR